MGGESAKASCIDRAIWISCGARRVSLPFDFDQVTREHAALRALLLKH